MITVNIQSKSNVTSPSLGGYFTECGHNSEDPKCSNSSEEQFNSIFDSEASDGVKNNSCQLLYLLENKLIENFDIDSNPSGTISIDNEIEYDGFDFYLHIEVGMTTCNWQYRIDGNRVCSQDGIKISDLNKQHVLEYFLNCLSDFPR